MANQKNNGGLGFEQTLWAAADKLRGHLDAAEYKHVVLGLISLKYISDAFQELHDDLTARQETDHTDPEDRQSSRARIRVMACRILRKYGYPPDMQEKATETVLQQAELIAADWAS